MAFNFGAPSGTSGTSTATAAPAGFGGLETANSTASGFNFGGFGLTANPAVNFNIGNFGVSTTSATPFNFGNSLASAGRYWGHVCNEYRGLESKNVPMFLEFGGRNGVCLIRKEVHTLPKVKSSTFQVWMH